MQVEPRPRPPTSIGNVSLRVYPNVDLRRRDRRWGCAKAHGILKSNKMARAFFRQIAVFFYTRVHFKIKDMDSRRNQPDCAIAFNVNHTSTVSCALPAQSHQNPQSTIPSPDTWNARRRGRGAKSGDPFDPKSSGDERDAALVGLRLIELQFYYLT